MNQRIDTPIGYGSAALSDQERRFPSLIGLNRREVINRALDEVEQQRGTAAFTEPSPVETTDLPPAKDLERPWRPGMLGRATDPELLLTSGVIRGTGAIISGTGGSIDAVTDWLTGGDDTSIAANVAGAIADGARAAGREVSSWSEWFEKGLSPEAKAGLRQGVFAEEADLFAPSTWSFDDEATASGVIAQTTRTFGEMGPVVLGGVYRAALGAVTGGLQSFHYGEEGARAVTKRAAETGELQETPGYQALRDAGRTELEAINELIKESGQIGGALASLAGAGGGYVFGRLANAAGPGRNALSRAAAGGGLGSATEGAQEVLEGMGSRAGSNIAAEQEIIGLTEGTLEEFAMGALAGGPTGAVAGAVDRRTEPEPAPESQAPLTLTPDQRVDTQGPDAGAPLRLTPEQRADASPLTLTPEQRTDVPSNADQQPSSPQQQPAEDASAAPPADAAQSPQPRQAVEEPSQEVPESAAETSPSQPDIPSSVVPPAQSRSDVQGTEAAGAQQTQPEPQDQPAPVDEQFATVQTDQDTPQTPTPTDQTVPDEPSEPPSDAEQAPQNIETAPAAQPEQAPEPEQPAAAPTRPQAQVRDAIQPELSGGTAFKSITQARKIVRDRGIEADNKAIDEGIEEAVVHTARDIVQNTPPENTFEAVADLYQRQPGLNVRTTTSMTDQAYSTPAPIAYAAGRMVNIGNADTVYEPAAGNGMLLIGAASDANITANELNPERVASLRDLLTGKTVTEGDATQGGTDQPKSRTQDVVIMNPPFGSMTNEQGRKEVWPMFGGVLTDQIDHAIAVKALSSMKNDGRAAIIVGGVKLRGDVAKKPNAMRDAYRTGPKRKFYGNLYSRYNVTHHIRLEGDLYRKQGAQWPVDLIIINGRGEATRDMPMKTPPETISSMDELGAWLAENEPSAEAVQEAPQEPEAVPQEPDPVIEEQHKVNSDQPMPENAPEPEPDPAEETVAVTALPGGEVQDAPMPREPEPDPTPEPVPGPPEPEPDSRTPDDLPNREAMAPAMPAPETTDDAGLQAAYTPVVDVPAIGTQSPANMAGPMRQNMELLQDRVGNLVSYVADRLGMDPDKITDYLAAEQIEGVATAINRIENGESFVIGDQTGIGKGRQAAAILVYARQQGKPVIFVTEKPELYADMVRDLRNIGEPEGIQGSIAITNSGLRGSKAIRLSEEDPSQVIESLPPKKMEAVIEAAKTGTMPEGTDFLFTTYDQNTAQGKKGFPKRSLDLMEIAPNAIIVMDEAHNAGGTQVGRGQKPVIPGDTGANWATRADFFRDLVQKAQGTLFLSATYSKNPNTMTLYRTAGFEGALDDMAKLESIMADGGVPMEQFVSQRLARSGNLIRRESSFDGISFETTRVDVGVTADSDGIAGEVADIMGSMLELDKDMKEVREDAAEEWLNRGAANITKDDISGIEQIGFGATMHNVVGQMLLTLKAPSVADQAIKSLKRGEKPIIYIENTNEAMMNEVIEAEDIQPGSAVEMTLPDVLERQLDKITAVTVKMADGTKERIQINPSELPSDVLTQYEGVRDKITDLRMSESNLSALPIDTIRDRITAAGYNIDEITGRSNIVRDGVLERRKTGAEVKRSIREGYNSGRLDALVLNRSGSTGVSLHAMNNVGDANDGKPRHMIIMQPAPDPNTFMQSLGRVNRTGQSVKPTYEFVFADIPAESRFISLLLKKLASLNAQVSGARAGQVEVEGADYFNKVGDEIWASYLNENTDIAESLNLVDAPKADVARKATGRIAILPPREAETMLSEVDEAYEQIITEMEAAGVNPLAQMNLELDAQLLGYAVMRKGSGTGAFGDDTRMSVYSTKRQGKKVKIEDAKKKAEDGYADQSTQNRIQMTYDRLRNMVDTAEPGSKIRQQISAVMATMRAHLPGTKVMWSDIPGYVTDIKTPASAKKLTPSNIQLEITHAFGTARVSLSSITNSTSNVAVARATDADFNAQWLDMQSKAREMRVIMTGNLLSGFESNDGEGSVVRFTMADGATDTGIILSKKANPASMMEAPLSLARVSTESLTEFVQNGREIRLRGPKDAFGFVEGRGDRARVTVAKGRGARSLVTGQDVKGLVNFTKDYQGNYTSEVDAETLPTLLQIWRSNRNVSYQPAPRFTEEAYDFFGLSKPEFIMMDVPEGIAEQTSGMENMPTQSSDGTQRLVRDDPARAPRRSVAELQAEMTQVLQNLGMGHRVSVTFSDNILQHANGSFEVARYAKGLITVATRQTNHEQSMNHEAIHALRDRSLWGRKNGLFTDQEWEVLSKAAQNDAALMQEMRDLYDLDGESLVEEAVAEMYARFAQRVAAKDTRLNRILTKIRDFFRGMRRALTGYTSADQIMSDINAGRVGGRSRRELWDPDNPDRTSRILTDAMGAKGGANILGLVHLHPLVMEVGRRTPALKEWLLLKRNSDAERLEIHNRASDIVKTWTRLWRSDREAGAALNKLMHDSTLWNLFPTQKLAPPEPDENGDINPKEQERYERSLDLNKRYKALPELFKSMYWKVRREYIDLSDKLKSALEDNINHQTTEGLKRINDRFDERSEAATSASERAEVETARDAAIARFEDAVEKTLKGLRQQFEGLRKSVYFPLGRYGKYAVNVTDADGKTVSFSLFETAKAQQDYAADIAARPQDFGLDQDIEVSSHVMDDSQSIRDMVPGSFVAAVENMIAERDDLNQEARDQLMDQIWQTWLRTFPDLSIRKAQIHRKGTPGFSEDAIRNLADRSFHAGHQISRTRVGGAMDAALKKAKEEAKELDTNRERGQFVVAEVERRHDYWNQPEVAPWAAQVNQLTFAYYLGVTPAAAAVNLSQNTILGPAILGARYQKQGVRGAIKEIGKAAKDFGRAGFDFSKEKMTEKPPKNLTKDERAALAWARDMGLIERTETFALAEMAEEGVQANPDQFKNKVLNVLAWSFQASEIANRSIAMLASYRMARKAGMDHEKALDEAWDMTLRIHFDYSSTARPRFTQGNTARVITQFKQFSLNLATRLAIDTKQSLTGATPEEKRAARIQLSATMGSFLLHAGIRGLPLYGTVAAIIGAFLPGEGGEDDLERLWANMFTDKEGLGPAMWNTTLKVALDGPVGALTNTNIRDRIGAADLFFRSKTRVDDASETWAHAIGELLGPAFGAGESIFRGAGMIADGHVWRGTEAAMPKFVRDVMKGARYAYEGEITTLRGDTLVERVSPITAVRQAIGFSSLSQAEQYRLNARLQNDQKRIQRSRGRIIRDVVQTIEKGGTITDAQFAEIMRFNSEFPGVAITKDTLRRSFKSRGRRSDRMVSGTYVDPRLADQLLESAGTNPY